MLARSIRYVLRLAALLLLLVSLVLLVVWAAFISLQVDVPLDFLRQPIQAISQATIGRPLQVRGPITLWHSFNPSIELRDIRIPNRSLQPGNILEIDQLIIEINPWTLLLLNFEVQRLYAEGVQLALLRDAEHQVNWNFADEDLEQQEQPPAESNRVEDSDVIVDLGVIEVRDLSFSYRDVSANLEIESYLEQLSGQAVWGRPLTVEMAGTLEEVPAALTLQGDSLQALLSRNMHWTGLLAIDLGKVNFEVGLDFAPLVEGAAQNDQLRVSMSSSSLADLSELFDVSYPDWGPWSVSGEVNYRRGVGYRFTNARAELGESHLLGELVLDLARNIPSWHAELVGGELQMNDFALSEFWDEDESETTEELAGVPNIVGLDKTALDELDLRLVGQLGEVYAGHELIGSGQIDVGIGLGVVSVTDLKIESSDGVFAADLGFRPEADMVKSRIAMVARNFNYGPLLRRTDPDASNDGKFDARIDLVSESAELSDLLEYATGEIAFTLWPEEFETQELDMWAAGLIGATFTQYGSDSKLNCVVARFDVENGLARDRAVMLDTSGMRVFGDGTIDFRGNLVDLYLIPKPKDRALLNLAIPVRMTGSFEDFEFGVRSDDFIKSYFRNAFRIWLAGIPLLFQETMDPDGSRICRLAMETDIDIRRPPGDLDGAYRDYQ